jgi:hypothetical protein
LIAELQECEMWCWIGTAPPGHVACSVSYGHLEMRQDFSAAEVASGELAI